MHHENGRFGLKHILSGFLSVHLSPFLPPPRIQLAVTSVNFIGTANEHYLTLWNTSTNDDDVINHTGEVMQSFASGSATLYPAAVTFSRDGQNIYVYYPETTVRFD